MMIAFALHTRDDDEEEELDPFAEVLPTEDDLDEVLPEDIDAVEGIAPVVPPPPILEEDEEEPAAYVEDDESEDDDDEYDSFDDEDEL